MTHGNPSNLFHAEYEQELETWLRRRFRYFCYALAGTIGFGVLMTLTMLIVSWVNGEPAFGVMTDAVQARLIGLAGGVLMLGVVARFLFAQRRLARASREQILRATTAMILLAGGTRFATDLTLYFGLGVERTSLLALLFLWHVLACALLPWKPRESLTPFVPLMAVWAVYALLPVWPGDPLSYRVLAVALAPVVLLPGLWIASLRLRRHSREFSQRMVGRHFISMRRELAQARSIHDGMFPQRFDDGSLRFSYVYQPMRELGGDFIHAQVDPGGTLHLTLLDVTGHGLAAALTVNRLCGELDRIRGENRDARPVDVLRLLNRYVHLTMARHDIYVTAACVSIDPVRGRLRWANGGHPPGFVRSAGGNVTELGSTAMMLGAIGDDGFEAEQVDFECVPGDELILYTDGAFEARNAEGHALGLATLRRMLCEGGDAVADWPRHLAAAVQRHQAGRPDDDTLIASVRFTAFREPAARDVSAAHHGSRTPAAPRA